MKQCIKRIKNVKRLRATTFVVANQKNRRTYVLNNNYMGIVREKSNVAIQYLKIDNLVIHQKSFRISSALI